MKQNGRITRSDIPLLEVLEAVEHEVKTNRALGTYPVVPFEDSAVGILSQRYPEKVVLARVNHLRPFVDTPIRDYYCEFGPKGRAKLRDLRAAAA